MNGRILIGDADSAVLRPLTVAELLKPVLRRKLLLLATMLVFVAAAVAFLTMVEPRYRSAATVLIKPTSPEAVVEEAWERLRLTVDQEEVRSQIEVVRSRGLIEPVVERLNLAADRDFNPRLDPSIVARAKAELRRRLDPPPSWLGGLGTAVVGLLAEGPIPDPVEILQTKLRVDSVNRSNVLEIALETRDPALGTRVVNEIAEAYQAFTLHSKSSMTEAASAQLVAGITELQQNIGASERRIAEIREAAGIMQGRTATLIAERVSDVSAELFRVRGEADALASRQEVLHAALASGGDLSAAIDVSASPVIGGLRQREADARARLAQVATTRGPQNPQVQAAQAELADVQRFIRAELAKIGSALANELSIAREREADLRRQFEALTGDVAAANRADLDINALEREVSADRAVLATFMSRLKSLRLQDALEKPDAQVISYGVTPIEASYPKPLLVIGLAVVASLVVGVALVTIVEHRDDSFRTLEQVEDATGVPVAALLPLVRGRAGSPEQGVVSHPTGLYAEAVKQLLVATCRNRPADAATRVVVSSSLTGEGKTTTAVALGRMASLCGFRTLIVDGDLRQGRIAQMLKLRGEPGLIEILNRDAEFDAVVQADPVSGAHVLSAGRFSPRRQGALNTPVLHDLFAALTPRYDLIVIDTSPVLAVSDTHYFLDLADTNLFVVQWGSTPRAVVRSALHRMANSGERVDAIVVSKVDMHQQASYGAGQYGNYTAKLRHYTTT